MVRHRPRKDANHAEIVSAAIKCGMTVLDTAALGNGAPDVVFGYGGLCICAEIKDGKKPPSARKLTADEESFRNRWTGGLVIVESVDDVLRAKYTMLRWHEAIALAQSTNEPPEKQP